MIDVASDGGTAVVTINRPQVRNALDVATIRGLTEALQRLDADDAIDAIVLTGADPAFCAGLDLTELAATGGILGGGHAEAEAARRGGPVPRLRKPLIGAINGAAITGGLELALNCDFLVASERALFGDTHGRVGLQPGWGGAVLLVEAVGVRRAREMSFTGNFVDAEEALRIGLVNHVVPHAELLPFCTRLGGDIASADRAAVRRLRQTYQQIADEVSAGGWEAEGQAAREWQGRTFDPDEIARRREGVRARGRAQADRA